MKAMKLCGEDTGKMEEIEIPNPLKGEKDNFRPVLMPLYPAAYRSGNNRIFMGDYYVVTPRPKELRELPNLLEAKFRALFLLKTDFNDSSKNGYCNFLIFKKDESSFDKTSEIRKRYHSAEDTQRDIGNLRQLTQGLSLEIVNEGSRKGYVEGSSSIQERIGGVDDYLNIRHWFKK